MISPKRSDAESLALGIALRVDALCDRFEADWREGRNPTIEASLRELSEPERSATVRALIELELALRLAVGTTPEADEYRRRFPDQAELIDAAFGAVASVVSPARDDSADTPRQSMASRDRGAADESNAPGSQDTEPIPAADAPRTVPSNAGQRFRIVQAHARGGLGQVSLAFDRELGRQVALKEIQLRLADDDECRSRFVREAEITGRLEHPGIVPVYTLGRYGNGRPFYAMRFIEGETLREAIRRFHSRDESASTSARTLKLRQLLRRFVDVCNTIAYAHSRGVIHRDLKPANILLGPFGETLIVDWGLAKVLGSGNDSAPPAPDAPPPKRPADAPWSASAFETQSDALIGTPAYMSPEQAGGRLDRIGPSSDLYSLGATLYDLLTGRAPFESSGPRTTVDRVLKGDFPKPRQVAPRVPRPLEAICVKAMATRPEDRYPSAADLATDIERWVADEPVSAWPEPLARRAGRWLKQHRTLAGSAAAMTVVLLIALVVLAARERLAGRRVRVERDLADAHFQMATGAIERFRTVVESSVDVRSRPELAPLRQELLRQPFEFYEELLTSLEARPNPRPEDLDRLADAYIQLAGLTGEIGTAADAIAAYGQALRILLPRCQLESDNDGRHEALLFVYNSLGNLYRTTNQPTEALSEHSKALDLALRLTRTAPNNPSWQQALARAHNNLGNDHSALDRTADALRSYQAALEIHRRLVQAEPANPSYRRDVASTLINLGLRRTNLGQFDRAAADLAEAMAILDPIARDNPENIWLQRDLAAHCINLGMLQASRGQNPAAEASFAQAVSIFEDLRERHPSVLEFRRGLGKALGNLSMFFSTTDQLDEAVGPIDRSVRLLRELSAEQPENVQLQADLAWSLNSLGNLQNFRNDAEGALTTFLETRALWQRLWEQRSESIAVRAGLAEASHNLGFVLDRLDMPDEARTELERAVRLQREVFQHAPDLELNRRNLGIFSSNLARVHRRLGQPIEAIALIRERRTLGGDADSGDLFEIGRDLALCLPLLPAESPDARSNLADEAIEALRLAARLGYRSSEPFDQASLPKEFRDRADFQAVILDLSFPEQPFAH